MSSQHAAMVENLISKIKAWESEKGMKFLYNKVVQKNSACLIYQIANSKILLFYFLVNFFSQMPLLESLEEYILVRQHKEEEKRKSRVGIVPTCEICIPYIAVLIMITSSLMFSLFCRSRNDFRSNLLQSRKLFLGQSQVHWGSFLRESLWVRVPVLTHWPEHLLVAVFQLLFLGVESCPLARRERKAVRQLVQWYH